MNKLEIINELTNNLGAWSFYYHSRNMGQPPQQFDGKNARVVLCKLLKLHIDTENCDSICSRFIENFYQPHEVLTKIDFDKSNLEQVCVNLLIDLYHAKFIDPYLYYQWTFMSNGLAPFLFRGQNNKELMRSFRLNYRKALSKNCDRTSSSFTLLEKLDDAFRSFGLMGVTISEMVSFGFAKPVKLNKLRDASQFTINKYKRAY